MPQCYIFVATSPETSSFYSLGSESNNYKAFFFCLLAALKRYTLFLSTSWLNKKLTGNMSDIKRIAEGREGNEM